MKTVEIRVRPVVRHVVTRYTPSEPLPSVAGTEQRTTATLETLGEFDNEAQAEQVAEALADKEAPREYALVMVTFETQTEVYFAYSLDEAERRARELTERCGKEFRVYARKRPSLDV